MPLRDHLFGQALRRSALLCFVSVGLVAQPAEPTATATTAIPSAASSSPAVPETKVNAIENTVVKIFATVRRPDLSHPWTKSSPVEVTGSGVIIEGKRILTNAHVVVYGSQIQVQANQAGDKLPATVEAIAPGIDLAVLKLDDDAFFDSRPPIVRATILPDIKEPVLAYGYPTGGTSLSITKGIVSRIEFSPYNYPTSGLRIQIDAAINPGNSGGPAVSGDKMIGLAFSHLGNAQNISYIIPNEEIDRFLTDIADGKYEGKPAMFDELQTLENPALRAFLKLPKDVEGIVVREPYTYRPGNPLHIWDVITKIGDTHIDNQGMVKLGTTLRVRFQYLVQKIAQNGKVSLTLMREGKELTVELPVSADRPMLIRGLTGDYPSYFIFGPLVFSVATADFINAIAGQTSVVIQTLSAVGSPLVIRRGDFPAFPGEELVLVSSPFFSHKLAKGYGSPMVRIVEAVNGKRVKNLLHLVELLRDSTDEFVVIDFAGHSGESLVFPRQDCISATDDILTDNGVRAQGSTDTLALWSAHSAAAKSTATPAMTPAAK